MKKPTLMDSATTPGPTNGSGRRRCTSWIDSFVEQTAPTDVPVLFRKWAGIATLASVVEQKVWLKSAGSELYPNLYVLLVGHPGVGKTRAVRAARSYMLEIPEFHLAPTSVTAAAMIDALNAAKRTIIRLPDPAMEYNTMTIAADELGTFVHKYDNEMIAVLSAFYDPDPYGHNRRGKELKIMIKKPQLNLLCGSTPSNLLNLLPEGAWDQGFMSRMIMIFSDERIIGDDFATTVMGMSDDLIHDLKYISTIVGEAKVTEDFRQLVTIWRNQGEEPQPKHPKLIHYNTRRRAHFYKLCLLACVDRSDVLLLTREDFNRAMNWLVEAEVHMPEIFKAGAVGTDGKAMDEIYHYIMIGGEVPEHKLVNYARERVPAHSVMRLIDVMERSNMIRAVKVDPKTGARMFIALAKGPA